MLFVRLSLMNFDRLVHNISAVEQVILSEVVHAINISLTARNWILGYYIVEFEQNEMLF